MSVEVNEFKPLQFMPQLKYKVGNTFQYLSLDKFSFDKIRNDNMYATEKENFLQNKTTEPDYLWSNKPANYKDFKNHLNYMDNNNPENIFKIPHSSYYFTYENLNLVIKESNNKITKFSDNKEDYYSSFSPYNEDNYSSFFIVNKNNSDTHISDYFKTLKTNYDVNIRNASKISSTGSRSNKEIFNWNNDKTRQVIVSEFGKYLLTKQEIANANTNLKSNDKKLKNIITYYNILKILETFYINQDCILKEKIYEEINKGDIKETTYPVYIKIKQIKPVKLTADQIQSSFGYDILKPIYEIEFEKIDNLSKIEFHINFKDQYDPDRLINYKNTSYSIVSNDKYKVYQTSIFSNIKEKDIYVDINLDYNNYHNIKVKDSYFTTKTKINMNKLIKKYYIDKIYLKEGVPLKHANQHAIIKKVIIRALNKLSDTEQHKTLQRDIEDENLTFYNEKPSADIRLAIDNLQSKIISYLDVKVTYKDNLTDRIPLKQQLIQKLACIKQANTIDTILHSWAGDNYKKNTLENKMRIVNNTNTHKSLEQKGGSIKTNPKTQARKNLKKRRTLKNLIRYYDN
jgi:hypothetical protein